MIKIYCKKHPSYKGKRKPLAKCQGCKSLYEISTSVRLTIDPLIVLFGSELKEAK